MSAMEAVWALVDRHHCNDTHSSLCLTAADDEGTYPQPICLHCMQEAVDHPDTLPLHKIALFEAFNAIFADPTVVQLLRGHQPFMEHFYLSVIANTIFEAREYANNEDHGSLKELFRRILVELRQWNRIDIIEHGTHYLLDAVCTHFRHNL